MAKFDKIKLKEELKNLKLLTKKNSKKKKNKTNYSWIIKITILAFMLSFSFSFLSESTIPNVNLGVGILLVIFVIGIGVLFDMIGVSVTSANPQPFHSMSSRKVKGAKTAVKLIKDADKVSSFCNDVVGDICGIISGSAGAIISVLLAGTLHVDAFLTTLFVTASIAALTIGGKALGKGIAIRSNNMILFRFAKFLTFFQKEK